MFYMGVSNLWNGLWNGLMEWTDGMEYQLTKIDKTIVAMVKLQVLSRHCLLQLDCYVCLVSVFYPCTQAHTRNVR